MPTNTGRRDGVTRPSEPRRRAALRAGLLALPLLVLACGGEQAVPRPEKAAGGLSSLVQDSELKDPFAAKPAVTTKGEATPRSPSADLKDPFAATQGAAAGAEGPAVELKDPFAGERSARAPTSPAGEPRAVELKDPFRDRRDDEPAGVEETGLKDPFKDAPPDDEVPAIKDPFGP
ncbi:MAG: hypothetical protein R3A79_04380 [Nannocystaceae bacterium]